MQSSPAPAVGSFVPPHPGSRAMPRWDSGELIDAPRFTWRNWVAMIGPGLVMGGAAIGGGEWLVGPKTSAVYGGALLWLATLSIVAQVFYNLEVSRYTLYCGEPIFVGKFRIPPHPLFWLGLYLLLDVGSIFPYLAANAATPAAALVRGRMPDPEQDRALLHGLAFVLLVLFISPLFIGGKVYTSMKWLMSFKIVFVLGTLAMLALCYSRWDTWIEIIGGFFQFGNVPVAAGEGRVENALVALWHGQSLPKIDWAAFSLLSAMVAIAGQGGLTNTAISAYTRDQGWGMGYQVGAVPSMIGGQKIELSHVGKVFALTAESVARWRRWIRHLVRDQLVLWMPACFVGLALPTMLSVEFLPRGTKGDDWTVAGMTAGYVRDRVASESGWPLWGTTCWYLVLLCGMLALAPSVTSTADGFIRRWVDVFWTGSRRMQKVDPAKIRQLYFGMLLAYLVFGMLTLTLFPNPTGLVKKVGLIYNFALGISCWHTLAINLVLLPPPLRPNWFMRIGLFCSGIFFLIVAWMAVLSELHAAGVL